MWLPLLSSREKNITWRLQMLEMNISVSEETLNWKKSTLSLLLVEPRMASPMAEMLAVLKVLLGSTSRALAKSDRELLTLMDSR